MRSNKSLRIARAMLLLSALVWLLPGVPFAASAGPQAQAGAYHLELTTETGAVPVTGAAKLLLKVTDSAGKPVPNATLRALTKMPGMNMGERDQPAVPVAGQPGIYTVPAQFAMEGGYEATVHITGPQGAAIGVLPLSTGQNIGTFSGAPGAVASSAGSGPRNVEVDLLPWLAGGALVAFVLYRMRRTGQRLSLRLLANRSVLGGLLLLGGILWAAVYAVAHFRREGALTPLQVQGMEMNLPAPAGTAPVELAPVESGLIESTVRYTGQAVGYVEQDVTARVTGTITMLNVYVGDRVKRGQLLARLDTRQSAPLAAGQEAGLSMARQGVGVARKEYQQALAGVHEAHAEVGMKTGAVGSAQADLTAAREERASAGAQLDAARSLSGDASAQLQAAQADQQYWRDEMSREQTLLKAGAVTREEVQREKAQAENADAKVEEAQARIMQAQAQIRGAQSAARRAEATIASAQSKVQQAQSELNAHHAHVGSMEAAAESAKQKIAQAQAGVEQAQAAVEGASAAEGFSEIRAQTDGVVTQRVLSPGVLVSPGQTLLRVAQIMPIRLQASVSEADLSKVRVGSRALVNSQDADGRPTAVRISSVAPSIDPVARTGVVEALVPNRDRRFLPGQYVTMDISTGRSADALRIPTRAIRYHAAPSSGVLSTQTVPMVWIAEPVEGQKGQYTVREAEVRAGLSDSKSTEILSGVKAGQMVVVAGQDYLKNGDTVSSGEEQSAPGGPSPPDAGASPAPAQTSQPGAASPATRSALPNAAAPAPAPVLSAHPNPARALYTCLMHPEIVRDRPGACPKCGMALVPKASGARR